MDEFDEFEGDPAEHAMKAMEQMMRSMFPLVAPMLRDTVRKVLEENSALVNQDDDALSLLTEQIVRACLPMSSETT